MADESVRNAKFFTGCVRDSPDSRDRPLCAAPSLLPGGSLPKSSSLASEYPPAFSQGNTNSCTSNATANALRYLLRIGGGSDVAQSRLFIYWNARTKIANQPGNSDPGLQIRDAMKSVSKFNSVSEVTWPFDPVPERVFVEPSSAAYEEAETPDSFSYESVPQDESSIKSAIASKRPVVLGIELRTSFYSVGQSGIATPMTGDYVGWHAVTIVGYDDSTRMFELQNSWGPEWGKGGFFYMSYDYILNPNTANDLWAVKAFADGVIKPAPAKMVIRASDGSAIQPSGKAPSSVAVVGGSNFVWDLTATGPDTYTVTSPEHPETFLSCSQKLGVVDAFVKDDGSGRQRWTFNQVSDRKFKITVENGLDEPDAKFLTVEDGWKLALRPELPENEGGSGQIFNVGE
jgi:hypothetical protein